MYINICIYIYMYRYQIEADIAPFRGLLLGFFFITVGFNIDLAMIVKEAPKVLVYIYVYVYILYIYK
jgi:glutathione-regulated potassium-efflux system ancillary protein KefC